MFPNFIEVLLGASPSASEDSPPYPHTHLIRLFFRKPRMQKVLIALLVAALWVPSAMAQDQATQKKIRESLHQRVPSMPPIDEIRKSPIPGLYELRFGAEIFYVDANVDYLITGEIIDTKSKINLTEARTNQLTRLDFAQLDLQHAIVWKKGNGQRRLVVFADPFCSFCRQLEQELQKLDNVTVYSFLVPVVSENSPARIRDIWCAPDRVSAWRQWMLANVVPQRAMGQCEAPTEDNFKLYTRYKVHGTPGVFFEDGTRTPGFVTSDEIEQRFAQIKPGARKN